MYSGSVPNTRPTCARNGSINRVAVQGEPRSQNGYKTIVSPIPHLRINPAP